jgi:G-patch domain
MSKPISISFGKPKLKPKSSTPTLSGATTSLSTHHPKLSALTADPEEDGQVDDEVPPAHESVIGFASDGVAILSRPIVGKEDRVIENKGNADWRTRGRPVKGTSQQPECGQQDAEGGPAFVEKEEASKRAGLQYAENKPAAAGAAGAAGTTPTNGETLQNGQADSTQQLERKPPQTADEAALSALLTSGKDKSSSSDTIIHQAQSQIHPTSGQTAVNETLDFRTDVASRPDPSTLSEYAAMPVSEFGMALLRGMGKKRRANGEVIVIKNPNEEPDEEEKKRDKELKKSRDPNMGYLGIGAKAIKIGNANGAATNGAREDGLGAWGKADMRRNKKGEGLYTPVMLRDRRTGELLSEQELEERKKAAQNATVKKGEAKPRNGEEDWRDRRDRNLQRDATGGRQRPNAEGEGRSPEEKKPNTSAKKMIEYKKEDEDGSRHSSSSSRRRSRSRDRHRHRHAPRDRDRDDRQRERDRSRSRSRSRSRNRDRDRDRDRSHPHRDRESDNLRRREKTRALDVRYDSAASSSSASARRGGSARRNGDGD